MILRVRKILAQMRVVAAIIALVAAAAAVDADDLNSRSTTVSIVDGNGNRVQVRVQDLDNLHHFNFFFDTFTTNEDTGSGAVQALQVVWLEGSRPGSSGGNRDYRLAPPADAIRMRDWQRSGLNGGSLNARDTAGDAESPFTEESLVGEQDESSAFGIVYGVGAVGIEQQWRTATQGSILGNGYWGTGIDNQILGPKAGMIWTTCRGPWLFDVQSFFMLGINSGQITDKIRLGADLIPAALNRPLYATPFDANRVADRQSFTPVGELNAQARLRLTDMWSLRTAWSSLIVGNLLHESGELRVNLPEPTFVVESDSMVVHQLYCGVEYAR
jgi:hypothetical protein